VKQRLALIRSMMQNAKGWFTKKMFGSAQYSTCTDFHIMLHLLVIRFRYREVRLVFYLLLKLAEAPKQHISFISLDCSL
jgi:hypothetical protein